MEEKVKKRSKKRNFKWGWLIIILVIYIPSIIHWFWSKNIVTDVVVSGTIEDFVNTRAYIVRSERQIVSPISGNCIAEVSEGEKAGTNATIATILNGQSKELLKQIEDLDLNIIQFQSSKKASQELFASDLTKIDNQINQGLKNMINESLHRRFLNVANNEGDIARLIEKKAAIITGTSTSDAYLNSLKQRKDTIKSQLAANTRDITYGASGIVSYNLDGYEQVFNPDSIKDFTPALLEKVKTNPTYAYPGNLNVEAGKAFAKVITGLDYYFVVVLDASRAGQYKVDDAVGVRVIDVGKQLDGLIYYKSNEQNGKCVLAIKVDKLLNDTAGLRVANVDLIKSSFTGLKVPLSCLTNVEADGKKAKIMAVKSGVVTQLDVNINGKNDTFAIIDNPDSVSAKGISLYDGFVVNPRSVYEGQIVYGDNG